MDRDIVSDFIDTAADRPLLGLVYGRRRIGKSTLLVNEVEKRNGFYFEATRVSTRVQLDRLGTALGDHLGVGRIALDNWEQALRSLLALGAKGPVPVVIDEFGHVLDADRAVERRRCRQPVESRVLVIELVGVAGHGSESATKGGRPVTGQSYERRLLVE